MKRLCFLLDNTDHARDAVRALHREGIADPNVMVFAREGMPLVDLPPGTIDETDAMPGLARGVIAGVVLGTIIGVILTRYTGLGSMLGSLGFLWFVFFGAVIGGFANLLGGSQSRNTRLKSFEAAMARGEILLMVAVKPEQEQVVRRLLSTECHGCNFVGLVPRAHLFG